MVKTFYYIKKNNRILDVMMNNTQLTKIQGGVKYLTVGEQQPLNIHLTG
jgi:hypothetical protein